MNYKTTIIGTVSLAYVGIIMLYALIASQGLASGKSTLGLFMFGIAGLTLDIVIQEISQILRNGR